LLNFLKLFNKGAALFVFIVKKSYNLGINKDKQFNKYYHLT